MQKKYNIGIIGGNGKMGKFFAQVFHRYDQKVSLWGRKSDRSLQKFCEGLDIIMVSVPIDCTAQIIAQVGEYMTADQCICDVTSLKKFPTEAMKQTGKKFFGMHPMFAPAISGKMEGQNVIFCSGNAPVEESFCKEIFKNDGAEIIDLAAVEHDKIMSLVQGLSHFLDVTFIKTLEKSGLAVEKIFGSRSPAYAIKMMMAGRTLAQDSRLYGNIQIQNPENNQTLKNFLSIAAEVFETVEEKNLPKFEKIFEEGKSFLAEYADKSQQESDLLIDFLAHKILRTSEHKKHLQKQSTPELHMLGSLGPRNTFSHIAAKKFFGDRHPIHLFASIPAIFSALKKGKIAQALVPVENLLHGSVAESIDGIVDCGIPIKAMYEMKISPSLFAAQGTRVSDITEIYSHPQPLAQCSAFLEKKFPNAQYIPTHSTTIAIAEVLHNPKAAAIAAPEIIQDYPLQQLHHDIANTKKNATRFAFLTREDFTTTSNTTEGTVIFILDKDAPGALEKMLHAFSSRNINLTKIESRPTGKAFGEYLFFVTYAGTISQQEKKNFFGDVDHLVQKLKFLGEYGIFES